MSFFLSLSPFLSSCLLGQTQISPFAFLPNSFSPKIAFLSESSNKENTRKGHPVRPSVLFFLFVPNAKPGRQMFIIKMIFIVRKQTRAESIPRFSFGCTFVIATLKIFKGSFFQAQLTTRFHKHRLNM